MKPTESRRFLTRTGFDPSDSELRVFENKTQQDAAQWVVQHAKRNTDTLALPAWSLEKGVTLAARRDRSAIEQQAYRGAQNRAMQALRQWWISQMITTSTPLKERMVVFWHNHFVSSDVKVIDAHIMLEQHQLLREHALGSFKVMLKAISKNPAMLIYLDGIRSVAQAPNENFAREVMELFTLGEGQYKEKDIKEAARAFTGWTVNPQTNAFSFNPRNHDSGQKSVMGKEVEQGDDVLEVLLAQPACAQFIVAKLWREFISPQPDAAAVQRIANRFRDSNYDIATALALLLSEPALLASENEAALVKSPIELVVGTVRRFEVQVNAAAPLMLAVAAMGQILFAPPNVKGWQIGTAWINATTLLARKQALASVFGYSVDQGPAILMMSGAPTMAPTSPKDLTGMVESLPARFRRVARTPAMNGGPADLVINPANWLQKHGFDPVNTVREPQRSQLIESILLTAPALLPDSSLEGLPLLYALLADAAYQVK